MWINKANSTCGISVEESDDGSLVGTWTAMADVGGGGDRVIRSSVVIGNKPEEDEEKTVVGGGSGQKFLGIDVGSVQPYVIAVISVGGLGVVLLLVLVCLVCHYRNRAKEKKNYEMPQVNMPWRGHCKLSAYK